MYWTVISWSAALVILAIFNFGLWARAARRCIREAPLLPADVRFKRRLQCWLSGIYVLGCAFRSIVPIIDVPRVALVDSALASVLVGRTVATVAELAFVAQWALMLRETARHTTSRLGLWSSRLVLPLIFLAELCSWYSVLTTANIGHVIEESLWTASVALLVASLLVAWRRWLPAHRPAVVLLCAVGFGYIGYMVTVDVPRYLSRWAADEAAGRSYLTMWLGLQDIAHPHRITYEWKVWRSELDWMFMYFGIGVWTSIALIHSPLAEQSSGERRGRIQ